tara:strand:- start:7874 stop:9172 length:1299 start_codon:yes stop_codon:yes gene_type:complete
MNNFIILGNKGYNNIDLNDIIDIFNSNIRCNITIPNNNNGTKIYHYIFNVHLYENLIQKKMNKKEFIEGYKNICKEKDIEEFYNFFHKNKDKLNIIKQRNINYDNFLRKLGCSYSVNRSYMVASCGYNAILDIIMSNIRPFVFGYGLSTRDRLSFYYKDVSLNTNAETRSPCHNEEEEINILKWLHYKYYIDATMCMLKDNELPTFDCSIIKPKQDVLLLFLQKYGIVILENFYPEQILNKIIYEYHRLFEEKSSLLTYTKGDDGEDGEPRLFNAEKYSDYILNFFSNNQLFNNIASNYIKGNLTNKKTLINKVAYRDSQKTNSGGGWHRDNHNMQFKTIMYLSDVTDKNGNFQFITNSSKKYIGYPKPRTENYNTRYSEDTIKDILKNNNNCKVHDIIGDKGTIIIVDTTNIHRGKDILEGERYAITEYYI